MTDLDIEIDEHLTSEVRLAIERAAISRVTWLHRSRVTANDYNPNRVAPPEMELLIRSILEDGFTQPIVVWPDGDALVLIDGYHRWMASGDERIVNRYGGYVPVVRIEADRVGRMISTVRHNRARGTHAVLLMADIVRSIIEGGVPLSEIETRLGMEAEEIDRLADRSGMPKRAGESQSFGSAWVPR